MAKRRIGMNSCLPVHLRARICGPLYSDTLELTTSSASIVKKSAGGDIYCVNPVMRGIILRARL